MTRLLNPRFPSEQARPSSPARMQRIDVEGMIRQASTRVSVDQLVRKGRKYISLLSRETIDELINRSVRTIVDKHRGRANEALSSAQVEAESQAEFEELLRQYQRSADVASDVERSRKTLEGELQEASDGIDKREQFAASGGGGREIAMLQKRLEKLLAHIATMEAALKTLSTAKTFSNQQVQNLLREFGLAQEDKNFEKKKEMLKVVFSANQGIRKKARELAARGITLDAPEEQAVFTDAVPSLSAVFSRSPV